MSTRAERMQEWHDECPDCRAMSVFVPDANCGTCERDTDDAD